MSEKIQWAALTHVGLVRDHNEDNFFVDDQRGIGFVADGMGGHDAGEVASALAVAVVQESTVDGKSLEEAMIDAHRAIVAHPQGGGRRNSMGTTGVGVRISGTRAEVTWVGDSRAYLFDGDTLRPISKDHTPVQDMVDAGLITVQQARNHARRNEISQALGVAYQNHIYPSTVGVYFSPGSVILLCSDGLTEHLPDEQIQSILAQGTRNLEGAAQRLLDMALDEGGSDNITILLAKALA